MPRRVIVFIAFVIATATIAGITAPAARAATSPASPLSDPSDQIVYADNADRTAFHLLWRGRQKQLPGAIDYGSIAAGFAEGTLISQLLNQLPPLVISGSVISAVIPLGWIYSAVTGILFVVDAIDSAMGGTRASMERFSGYCKDTWEVYAKVNIRSAFASRSADMTWQTSTRGDTQWIRYLWQTYLGRQPTCDELRGELGVMGVPVNIKPGDDLWNIDRAYAVLKDIVCNKKDVDGLPWSWKVAGLGSASAWQLADFCVKANTYGVTQDGMMWAFGLADVQSEKCNPTKQSGWQLARNTLKVADVPGQLDDLYATIGHPGMPDDGKFKDGTLPNVKLLMTLYRKFTEGIRATEWDAIHKYLPLLDSRRTRDLVCRQAKTWVQQPAAGPWLSIVEQDQVMRDFIDRQSKVPYGTNVVSQVVDAAAGAHVNLNLYQAAVGLTSGNCHDVYQQWPLGARTDTQVSGTWCQKPERGWSNIGVIFGALTG